MYREFFNLQLKPFSITPDPRFLYMSPGHKEALAHLLYGLKEASGFVVITGEVGTGKTTILNAFLLKLPPRMPKVVIKNPHIKPENLYFLLGEAIGLPEEKRSRDYITTYEDRLKEMGGAVLIVDESQGLSMDMLEEIEFKDQGDNVNVDPKFDIDPVWLDRYSKRSSGSRGKVQMDDWNKARQAAGLPLIASGGEPASGYMPA